jgi:hypothetical protein
VQWDGLIAGKSAKLLQASLRGLPVHFQAQIFPCAKYDAERLMQAPAHGLGMGLGAPIGLSLDSN